MDTKIFSSELLKLEALLRQENQFKVSTEKSASLRKTEDGVLMNSALLP